MNTIRKFFVTARHWQLFLLWCGVGVLGGTAAFLVPTSASPWSDIVSWFISLVAWIGMILWAWSLGSFLRSLAPNAKWLSLRLFGVSVVYPFIWVFLLNVGPTDKVPTWFFLLSGFSFLFCIYYALYFLSKSLVVAETGKAPTLFTYLLLGFLFHSVPIGVWFLQPRINRLFVANASEPSESACNV